MISRDISEAIRHVADDGESSVAGRPRPTLRLAMSNRASWLAALVIGLACGSPTDGCGCPPTPASAAVFGRVQSSGEVAVANATVSAYVAREGNCGRRESPDGVAVTRSDGTYTAGIVAPDEAESACVLVSIRAPVGSGLMDAPDTAVTLAIRLTPPFDSTRVDATLSAP